MDSLDSLSEIVYNGIFLNGDGIVNSPYFQRTDEGIDTLVKDNLAILETPLEGKIFLYKLIALIKENKINLINEQKGKFGQILFANHEKIIILYDWLQDLAESSNLSDFLKKKNEKPPDEINSFKLTNSRKSNEDFESAFNVLINGNFISQDSKRPNFKRIFSGNTVDVKIHWIGDVNELNYFIKRLHNDRNSQTNNAVVGKVKNKWHVTVKCFTGNNKTGEMFTPKMLETNSQLPKPDRTDKLKKCVKFLT